jgi:hypothetical protein
MFVAVDKPGQPVPVPAFAPVSSGHWRNMLRSSQSTRVGSRNSGACSSGVIEAVGACVERLVRPTSVHASTLTGAQTLWLIHRVSVPSQRCQPKRRDVAEGFASEGTDRREQIADHESSNPARQKYGSPCVGMGLPHCHCRRGVNDQMHPQQGLPGACREYIGDSEAEQQQSGVESERGRGKVPAARHQYAQRRKLRPSREHGERESDWHPSGQACGDRYRTE